MIRCFFSQDFKNTLHISFFLPLVIPTIVAPTIGELNVTQLALRHTTTTSPIQFYYHLLHSLWLLSYLILDEPPDLHHISLDLHQFYMKSHQIYIKSGSRNRHHESDLDLKITNVNNH